MIEEFKIGSFKVAGKKYLGDLKMIEGKARYWQERHKQTLREEDLIDLFISKPEIIVIGIGCSGLLEISDELQREIKRHCKELIMEKTPEACKTYNKLHQLGRNVAAIFHATG